MHFKIGSAEDGNLLDPDLATVPATDVPEEGLATDWLVTSDDVELVAAEPDARVDAVSRHGRTTYVARFRLDVPHRGESPVLRVWIIPLSDPVARLQVVIYRRNEVYRKFDVNLPTSFDPAAFAGVYPLSLDEDLTYAPLSQTGLVPASDRQAPPGNTSITVLDGSVHLVGEYGSDVVDDILPWDVSAQQIATQIVGVRNAAEGFRSRWSDYLDDLDPEEVLDRLGGWTLRGNWSEPARATRPEHEAAWEGIASSDELRTLAITGRRLFHGLFERDGAIDRWLSVAPHGHRVNIHWTRRSKSTFVPHVPWGLMHIGDVPGPGQPVDPTSFLGLRFRLAYMAYATSTGSKALGEPDKVHRLHFLYWGTADGDRISAEARSQRASREGWGNHVLIPESPATPDAKRIAVELLQDPRPDPAVVLYLFCASRSGGRYGLELLFGPKYDGTDIVGHTDLGSELLRARPLVFANACATSGTDPHHANEMETIFFNRDCRGYLGTETLVPVALASRFADIFFHIFDRRSGGAPVPAGEAVAQSRFFLWSEFRNIGGLLYTYVNQYELFMAGEDEVVALYATGKSR